MVSVFTVSQPAITAWYSQLQESPDDGVDVRLEDGVIEARVVDGGPQVGVIHLPIGRDRNYGLAKSSQNFILLSLTA